MSSVGFGLSTSDLMTLIVLSDAVVFYLFNGYWLLGVMSVELVLLLVVFYRNKDYSFEWLVSLVIGLSLFINNYSLIWPYTTYGLFRLEYFGLHREFVNLDSFRTSPTSLSGVLYQLQWFLCWLLLECL